MNKITQKNLLDLVKRNYEEIAADFNTTREKVLWPEIEKLSGMVKDGDRILDAGCGNGRLFKAFGAKKIFYLGVDSSEKLIEKAEDNYELSIKNYECKCQFKMLDILELNKLAEKDFDYIFSVAVLHHLPGKDLRIKALELMKNKLKPDGKIIITVWNLWSRYKFRKLIFKYACLKILSLEKIDFGDILFDWKNNRSEGVSRRYYHAFTKGELKKIASAAGLKVKELYKDKYNYYLVLGK
jgi:SAM-dependent methyltransferase